MRLNFIGARGRCVFRRYYRQGLRSHIMEVLDPAAVLEEKRGILHKGIRWFPRARPIGMLRIFRTRFNNLGQAVMETRKLKLVEKYLGRSFFAVSSEFIADYFPADRRDFILCGLQEYVQGRELDPWRPINADEIRAMVFDGGRISSEAAAVFAAETITKLTHNAGRFIAAIKKMISASGHVPDLAGVRNILFTPAGDIKLVDINNISKVSFAAEIAVDDKGYPVCDKSIEALARIEQYLLGRRIDRREKIYRTFLDPVRMKEVQIIEKAFRRAMPAETTDPQDRLRL